ncbi:MAG: nucleotide exchange factor GrpE [Pseudomonadota bacterium]
MTENDPKTNKTETPEAEPAPDAQSPFEDLQDGLEEAAEPSVEDDLRAALAENEKLRDQLLRTLADAENARRRAERDREEATKYGISRFAKDLLTVADNLRRALEAVAQTADAADALKALAEGVAATEREMLAVFERNGLEKIDPADEPFDPNVHQAMFEMPGTDKPAGTVVQVMAPGYQLHGRLLRPAMVGVAKGEVDKQAANEG